MSRKRRPLEVMELNNITKRNRLNREQEDDEVSPKKKLRHESHHIISQLSSINGYHSDSSADTENLLNEADNKGEAGSIERVYVRNFMCHNALEINLNQNVNFLVGRNGSGKSAILTALVVGLGGRATATNRGNTVKGFIKKGENMGLIEIMIRNDGPFAFKKPHYGKKITIIRSINVSGSSSYKIKSSSGQIVSTSGKEVSRICEALNIQVDNPICILNQDTSRNFLNSNDPKKKYLLFMKATNLEAINDIYKKININKREMQQKLADKEIIFKEITKQLKIWADKYEMIQSLDSYVERLKNLENELFWHKYILIEKELEVSKKKIKKIEEECSAFENDIKEIENNETSIEDTITNLNRHIKEVETESNGLENQYQESKKYHYALRLKHESKVDELKQIQLQISRKINDYDKLDNLIADRDKSLEERAQQKQIQLNKKSEFENRLKEVVNQLASREHESKQLQGSIANSRHTNEELNDEIVSLKNKISQKNRQLTSMKRKSSDILSLYGNHMPRLLQEIRARKSQFTELPRGPLGQYIEVKDKRWAQTIEGYIKPGLLQSFCVTNQQDMKLLNEIMNKVMGNQRKPEIINNKFFHKVHDISKYKMKLPQGLYCLQDMLTISDPVVENCLIDNLQIESVLLIPSSADAYRIMSNIKNVPQFCSIGVTIDGDLFYPAPKYRTYAGRNKPVRFLQVSMAEAIQQFQVEIEELESQCQELNDRLKVNNNNLQQQHKLFKDHEVDLSKLRTVKMKIQKEINLIQIEPEQQSMDILLKELQEMKGLITEMKLKETQCSEELETLKKELSVAKSNLLTLEESMSNFKTRSKPLEKQKVEQDTKLLKLKSEKKNKCNHLQQLKIQIEELNLKLREKQVQLDNIIRDNDSQNRIDNPRSRREIEEEQCKIQTAIKAIKSDNEDPAYIENMYKGYKEKHDSVVEIIASFRESLTLLARSLEKRLLIYDQLIGKISAHVKNMFHSVLEIRNYQGSIHINHQTKELEISVQTQNIKSKTSDTRLLSGGERSYSTVAFIMSLWNCVKFPFYFMDEFDVFMDKVNRQTVMDLLLQHAEEHPERQFVFLTPQDISNITSKPNLAIHRMLDPERSEFKN